MATGNLDASPATANSFDNNTTLNAFIPTLWSDDIIAAYKRNLILANHVTKLNHVGKKGDAINIPVPIRGTANQKTTLNQVLVQSDVAGTVTINIDRHYEYSRILEDITAVQAIDSHRAFYTDDAGFALARQVDDDLWAQLESLQGGTVGGSGASAWEAAVIGGDGTTLYTGGAPNATALLDDGIRNMIQTLDDADVPQTDRALIVPPVERNNLMGIARFTEQSFVGEIGMDNTVRNGMIGDIYGIPVFVSSNTPSGEGSDRIGVMLHKDAIVHVEQMAVRSQTQYKQEWLGDLFTADTLYGVGELRDDAGVVFVVPS